MLEWSSLVPGPEAKSPSSESGNPTLFTKSYQFCPIVRITQDVAFSDRLLALGNVNLGSLQVFPRLLLTFSLQFSSVAQSCPTLCHPVDCRMPGFLINHQLPEFIQTHVHPVSDAIQPSHPLSSPSPPAFNLSQHQGHFQWVGSSHEVAKVLEFQLQHQSFQWIFRTDFL